SQRPKHLVGNPVRFPRRGGEACIPCRRDRLPSRDFGEQRGHGNFCARLHDLGMLPLRLILDLARIVLAPANLFDKRARPTDFADVHGWRERRRWLGCRLWRDRWRSRRRGGLWLCWGKILLIARPPGFPEGAILWCHRAGLVFLLEFARLIRR